MLRPVSIEETVNFWSAEQDLVARLGLFYEARVILLSTPPVTSTPGIVYSLGGFVSVAGQPFIESVQNLVGFVPPPGFAPPDPSSPFQFVSFEPGARLALPGGAGAAAGVAARQQPLPHRRGRSCAASRLTWRCAGRPASARPRPPSAASASIWATPTPAGPSTCAARRSRSACGRP